MDLLIPQAHAAVDSAMVDNIVQPIFKHVIQPVLTLLIVIAIFVFVYGVVEMIAKGGDADAREKGRNHIMYGVFGAVIMISAWGIIYLVANTVKSL